MRKLAVFLFFILPVTLFALDNENKWGVVFGIDSLDNLFTSYDGGAISLKYNINEMNSIRFGLDLYILNDGTSGIGYINDTTDNTSDTVCRSKTFSPNILYMKYLSSDTIRPYVGIGIITGYGMYTRKSDYEDVSLYGYKEEVRRISKSIGLKASMGAEYNPTDYLGLLLEYSMSYSYTYTEQTELRSSDTADTKNESSKDSFLLDYNNILLGIAIYF